MYFAAPNLALTLDRVDRLQQVASSWGLSLPDIALRFILAHPAVTTTIPGMRRLDHVESNLAASGGRDSMRRLETARIRVGPAADTRGLMVIEAEDGEETRLGLSRLMTKPCLIAPACLVPLVVLRLCRTAGAGACNQARHHRH